MLIQPQGWLGTLHVLFSKCKAKTFWGRIVESPLPWHTHGSAQQLRGRTRTCVVGTALSWECTRDISWARSCHQAATNPQRPRQDAELFSWTSRSCQRWKQHTVRRDTDTCPMTKPTQRGQGCSLEPAACYHKQPPPSAFGKQLGGYLGVQHPASV